ncbi:MAG: glycosyltransferase family 4 protein [Bacteroidota bacterium]|nr:glycosyltransferase family 4 protein [Bacteroidota bacterium]MDP4191166.1 glycosyltransferase family 4 protein [Bacteroidota bacterium]MDP4195038.1 glycosyltransferase family 4 protein [Bacteroidota bacterium]
MKIVHLLSSFSAGGAELLVKDIALNTDRSVDVEVWAMGNTSDENFEKNYIDELLTHNIRAVNVGKAAGRNHISAIIKLRGLLKESKPDVVNAHSELCTFYLVLASIGLGILLLETIHNTVINYVRLQKYLAKPFLKKFVAISRKCSAVIQSILGVDTKDIELVYNGIDIKKFQQKVRTIDPIVSNIIVIGRLDVQKDHHTLLKAYRILVNELKENSLQIPRLNIVGKGILLNELLKLAKEMNIDEYVNFLGVRNDISELLYQNDLWVMSSKWEGLSIALLEAMASGIPIIATNVGSNDELIDNGVNGTLVEKESPEELAGEIYRLIYDREKRCRYSEIAKEKALGFNIKQCADNYTKLYRSLLATEQPGLQLKGSSV